MSLVSNRSVSSLSAIPSLSKTLCRFLLPPHPSSSQTRLRVVGNGEKNIKGENDEDEGEQRQRGTRD